MSFVRPEAAAGIRRWVEPVVVALALALTVWQGVGWLAQGAGFGWIALVAAVLLAFWLRSALAGALARQDDGGPGVVVLREGEVGYMGPESGGFLDLGDIERVEIVQPSRGGPLWYLDAGRAGRLVVPANAEGADHLVEALAALPGFSDLGVAQALRARAVGRRVVWQRTARTGIAGPTA